ncbi:MAG: Cna B-type domain-containing protein [Eubacteriales bacterium]
MRTKLQKILSLILAVCMIAALTSVAFAADSDSVVDFNRKGSITLKVLNLHNTNDVVHSGVYTIYLVATAVTENHNLKFVPTADFAGCGISLDDLNAEGLAVHLSAYAQDNQLAGLMSASPDSNGEVKFENLELGLYLVAQTGEADGYYDISPFVISIPMTNEEGTGWVYDIYAYPKAEEKPEEPIVPMLWYFTVQKKWYDGLDKDDHDSVKIGLIKNGKLVDTVYLGDHNDWCYTWSNLQRGYGYDVVELEVPEGYTVSYSYEYSNKIIVKNTIDKIEIPEIIETEEPQKPDDKEPIIDENVETDTPEPDETEPQIPDLPETEPDETEKPVEETEPGLIQTGQLNWPVPVLAGCGLLLFMLGWILTFMKRKDKNA